MDWVHHRCHPREQATEIQRDPQALKHSLEAVQIGLTECLAGSVSVLILPPLLSEQPRASPIQEQIMPCSLSWVLSCICLLHILTKAFKIAQNSAPITMDTHH